MSPDPAFDLVKGQASAGDRDDLGGVQLSRRLGPAAALSHRQRGRRQGKEHRTGQTCRNDAFVFHRIKPPFNLRRL